MKTQQPPAVVYNVQRMAEDVAAKGWSNLEFAKRAGVNDMTVIRFFRGDHRTAPTARKLAKALGRSVRRYIVPAEAIA
jgi:transcriptional regulator with XRE-family HTH domain